MAYDELKSSGITENTPQNIMLGAGTIHKGFELGYSVLTAQPSNWANNYTNYYTRSDSEGSYTYAHVTGESAPTFASSTYYRYGWNFDESLIGATSGGGKVDIVPETKDIEVDGALVAVKGLRVKIGEKATCEVNFVEMTPDLMKMNAIGEKKDVSSYEGYDEIVSKKHIEEGDYINHFAYVGKKMDGTPIIIIFDYCICTSGLSIEGKNKETGVFKATFECVADLSPEADTLPWHILYPTAQG